MAEYIGKETTIEAGGKTYKLARYTRDLLDTFTDWARAQLPSPFEEMKRHIKDFPVAMQEVMIREVVKNSARKLSFDNPAIQDVMNSGKGVIKLISLLLNKHHPDLSEQEAGTIIGKVLDEQGENYLMDKVAQCHGTFPEKPE